MFFLETSPLGIENSWYLGSTDKDAWKEGSGWTILLSDILKERSVNRFNSHDFPSGLSAPNSRALTPGMNLGTLPQEDQGIKNLRAALVTWWYRIHRAVHNVPLLRKRKKKRGKERKINRVTKLWLFC